MVPKNWYRLPSGKEGKQRGGDRIGPQTSPDAQDVTHIARVDTPHSEYGVPSAFDTIWSTEAEVYRKSWSEALGKIQGQVLRWHWYIQVRDMSVSRVFLFTNKYSRVL